MIIPQWAKQYGNIPYKIRGRDRDGIDCWGLTKLVAKEQFGKDLYAFEDAYMDHNDFGAIIDCYTRIRTNFRQLAEPRCGAIVMFNIAGEPVHVGIMVNNVHFLNAIEGHVSGIERVTSPMWRNRIEGFYWYE